MTDEKETPPPLAGHPAKPLVYSSAAITERRRRILKEARRLIAEHGVEGFGIRELCRRADVAQRTLYNAFQNKDRIIALAIREAYEEANKRAQYKTSATTLEGIIDRLISINQRNFRARHYTKAVAGLYFSPRTSGDIVKSLQDMAFLNLRQWLDQVEAQNEFPPWIRRRELEFNFVNAEYAVINDWARGYIADQDYIRRLLEAILVITVGSTLGRTREQAVRMLEDITSSSRIADYRKPVSLRASRAGRKTRAPSPAG
jgi:AcrR family transcriptional regulator